MGKARFDSEYNKFSALADETENESKILYKELLDDLGMESVFGGKKRLERDSRYYRERANSAKYTKDYYESLNAKILLDTVHSLNGEIMVIRGLLDLARRQKSPTTTNLEKSLQDILTTRSLALAAADDDMLLECSKLLVEHPSETRSVNEIYDELKSWRARSKEYLENLKK